MLRSLIPVQFFFFFVLASLVGQITSRIHEAKPTRFCHRDWPQPGSWRNTPPYWQPDIVNGNGCTLNQEFGPEETKECMKGRTLYSMGNSIGRQAPFGMVELLGGATVKRENQRDMCPKHETTWDDSCHQDFAGVKLKYLFMQFMDGFNYETRNGFPFYKVGSPNSDSDGGQITGYIRPDGMKPTSFSKSFPIDNAQVEIWADDSCIEQNTEECFAEFFKESKEEDVLVFTLGMSYPLPLKGQKIDDKGVDFEAWLRTSSSSFRSHIAKTFKGSVFRVTLAKANPNRNLGYLNPHLLETNNVMWEQLRPGSELNPWYTIDQWSINDGRDFMYQDHLHFNGPLTHAMLHQVLNELCPGQGKKGSEGTWPNKSFIGKVVRYRDTRVEPTTEQLYLSSNLHGQEGELLKLQGLYNENGGEVDVPLWLAKHDIVTINHEELVNNVFGEDIPKIEGECVRGIHESQVYLIENGKKRPFPDADTFLSNGYNWDIIKPIPEWIVHQQPDGAVMTKPKH